ncbi:MAG TPA: FKBP-type peptidyl-prolyl cis-trans isomerase, partial [Pyrinomonadaceae bacterium]|nr:FKBP-type peptidyl-prolyl cis-trans isomerase [Pyrinomonadaceae bacterium]
TASSVWTQLRLKTILHSLYKGNPHFTDTKEDSDLVPTSRHRKAKAKKKPRGQYASSAPKSQPAQPTNWRVIAMALVAVFVFAAVVYFLVRRGNQAAGSEIVTASGLKYVDVVVGDGPTPKLGQTLSVHYTGTLTNGSKFDSSLDNGQPYQFRIGRGEVIKGWDEAFMTMRVGGKRKLIIPPNLGYGVRGNPPDIPPNSTLLFDVELLEIK